MTVELLDVLKTHLQNILKERSDDGLKHTMQTFKVTYTYDAISLEGLNRIPFEDVKRLIESKRLLEYSEREQKEVLNHVRAFEKVVEMVKHNITFNEERLKDLHEILVDGIFQGGIYRNVNVQLSNSIHQPTDHAKVYDRMHKLFEHIINKPKLSSIDKAVHFLSGIAKIHPFLGGNGRLSRLVMNYYLLEGNYLPISVHIEDKIHYMTHLNTFKATKDLEPITSWLLKSMVKRYEEVIHQLEITT